MSEDKQPDAPPPYPGPPLGSAPYPPVDPAYPPGVTPAYPPTSGTGYPPVSSSAPAAYTAPPTGTVYSTTGTTTGNVTVVTTTQHPVAGAVLVRAYDCPNCRAGFLVEQFTCCGILWAIFFFPFGLLCCLMMRIRVCSSCGSAF